MIGIYKITNKINEKVYIGQSVNIEGRWRAHRTRPFNKKSSQYDSPLYRAIRKHGLQNFTFEVLEQCSKNLLDEKEKYYITLYQSYKSNYGYNLTMGGQNGSLNTLLTSFQVEEIQQLLINTNLSEEKIAEQFHISQRLVSGINLGQYHIQTGIIYPLRNTRKKKNYCINCGKEISLKAERCIACSNKYKSKFILSNRPSREILKSEIRTIPFLQLGKKYGISDKAIVKQCITYQLPSKKSDIKKISDEEWLKI